jgi:predicted nicotinamide N-methyase
MLALPWRKHETLHVRGRAVAVCEGESTAGLDTTGSLLWDASQALLDHLVQRQDKDGRSLDLSLVVELGCGTGALGVALVWLGAARVVCTDLLHALPLAAQTLHRNGVASKAETCELAFGSAPPPRLAEEATLVLASDVVYAPQLVQPLCETLRHFAGAKILLCNKIRSDSLIRQLEAALPRTFLKHDLGDFVIHEM